MAVYLGKNIVLAFCVDYSASKDGRLVVYEAQHLLSDNYNGPNSRLDNLGRRSALGEQIEANASNIWESHFRKITSTKFVVEFPPALDGDKTLQRKHLFANCPAISPDFLLCNTETSIDDIANFASKHNRRVVVKGKGSAGNGNKFLSEHPEESLADIVDFYKRQYHSFVVEQEVMYSWPESENPTHGVCYRDIIFYDTETNELCCFEVYKEILDMEKSVNNHSASNSVSETCFFLIYTPSELTSLMKATEKKFPALYNAKKRAFSALSNQILHYLQTESFSKNLLSNPLLTLFINKFHADDKAAYQAYLKLGRFLDTKHQSDQVLAGKLDGGLKKLFSELSSFFSDEEKSISERKHCALQLMALKMTVLNAQDLCIFQHLLLSLRAAPGPSSLREIWHQKNFFSCFCCTSDPYANTSYGNTTTGKRAIKMTIDARTPEKKAPSTIYLIDELSQQLL